MTRLVQTTEFFVVGGPIQQDRPCYIRRRADQDLIQAVVDQRFAYVLSARGTGKTSLMAHAIRTLREEGELAAGVDLTQIGSRGESSDASRWFYSIAHRIVRELRLKVDLQAWWQERSALSSEQTFAEFFWEIVLTNTQAPVSIFFDEIERTRDLSFAHELFSVIRDCYSLRVSEPDYSRLNFVVLGVASPTQLCPDPNISPFVDGEAIALDDLSIEECYELAPGFDEGEETARGLLDRIYTWASGQPYFTQKLARAINRKGGKFEHVERVVQELFISQGQLSGEPLLNQVRAFLTARGPHRRAALVLLGRVAKGVQVNADAASPVQEELRLAGVVAQVDGQLSFRNRIVSQVFTEKWAKSALPFNWRGSATAAAILAVAILVPYWYFNSLPRPYIATLSTPNQEYAVAEDAYTRLHRLPGFAAMAEDLFSAVLVERSREASTLFDAQEADRVMRTMTGGDALADRLLGEFWLRRARQALHQEDRDLALMYAVEAGKGYPVGAEPLAGELISTDYQRLERSFRLPDAPLNWAVSWDRRELTIIDNAHRARLIQLDANAAPDAPVPSNAGADRLTALQHVPLSRELGVDDEGSAGVFELLVDVEHVRPSDITLTLSSPSGVSGSLRLSDADRVDRVYRIRARAGRALGLLADERRQGVWRLTLIDGQADNIGTLRSWALQFPNAEQAWSDAPEQGIAVPDPVRTEQVGIDVSRDGRFAVANPSREGAIGALAVWDLRSSTLLSDVQLDATPDHVQFSADGTRLLGMTGNTLNIWNAETGRVTGRLQTQTEFLLAPAVSAEGSYVAIAERVEGSPPLFSLARTSDGALVASVEGVDEVANWALGPEARYLALLSSARQIQIMDPRRGSIVAELQLERTPQRLIPIPGDDLLLTVDTDGDVRAWRFEVTPDGLAPVDDWRLGTTEDPDSISVAMDASTVAFATSAGHVAVHDLSRTLEPILVRVDPLDDSVRTQLAPDGQFLLTGNGALIRLWSLVDREAYIPTDRALSALAIDDEGRVAALGYRGGYVRAPSVGLLNPDEEQTIGVDYIGHRGAVSAIALNTNRNLIATGGNDGVVRAWNLASVTPSEQLMRHPAGPILETRISSDGAYIASAAEYSARVWRVVDGELVTEIPVNGTALAVAFSVDSTQLAVGDSAGNVFFGRPEATEPERSLRADAAINALAFSHDTRLLATGDAQGNVALWNVADATAAGTVYQFRHPVRSLRFDPDGRGLLVQTDQWMHRMDLQPDGFEVVASHLLGVDLVAGAAWIDGDSPAARLIGGLDVGRARIEEVQFSGNLSEVGEGLARFDRAWPGILGFELNADGLAVAQQH